MTPEQIRDTLHKTLGAAPELNPGPVDASLMVPPSLWHQACALLRNDPETQLDFLRAISGVDRPQQNKIEVVAHLFSYRHRFAIVLKTQVDRDNPELDTVSDVWPAANWHERELYDMFGVKLIGHPELRRILLPDDWVGYPLRKDYKEPEHYQGIPMQRPPSAAEKG